MPRDFRLRASENFHEVADADLLVGHQVEQPEARVIRQRLKELPHVKLSPAGHVLHICFDEYEGKTYIHLNEYVPDPAAWPGQAPGSVRPKGKGGEMLNVVFACVHNAGRSQMAAAFFNRLADPQKARAVSAGTEPGVRVHPEVQAVMQEVGIDLGTAKPQKLTGELAKNAQLLVTMGCGDKCPYVPGLRRDDWPLQDPKGLPAGEVRAIRDQIKHRVEELIAAEGVYPEPPR